MKAFAAACLISLSTAFSISAIDSLDFKDLSTGSDSKSLLKGIPQLEAAPAFDKVDGFQETIDELVADQKACSADAHAECAITIDEESKGAGFGLGKLVEGVQSSYGSLELDNAVTEKQALDAINDETQKQIDAQIDDSNKSAKAQLLADVGRGKINVTKLNAIHKAGGAEIKEVSQASNEAVATVSKDAAVVGILNKVAESNLIQDLTKVAEQQGGEASAIISAAEAPVKLDASALGVDADDQKKASEDLFGAIEDISGSFGDFGKLGFEKFGVVSLKPETDALFSEPKIDAASEVQAELAAPSPAFDGIEDFEGHDASAFES